MNNRLACRACRSLLALLFLIVAEVLFAADGPPVWISKPVTNATVGKPYQYTLQAIDPAGGAVTYSKLSMPSWMSLVAVPDGRIQTVAGTIDRGNGKDGKQVQLSGPTAGAYDAKGNLYVADRNNHRVWRLAPDGVMTTLAGTGEPGFSGDGGAATRARLFTPIAVAVDNAGNVYIADRDNHRIRRVSTAGIIFTVAGTGTAAFSGDGGPALAAALNSPSGLAWAPSGKLYISDTGNNRVRVVDPAGDITTIAGTGTAGYNGDGILATTARLWGPTGVALEADESVVLGDSANYRVRRIGPDGIIRTIAGTGKYGFSGDNGPATQAKLTVPVGVAVDSLGVLLADTDSNRIRRVGTDGIIRTVAGTGEYGTGGDGGPAVEADILKPSGVVCRGDGSFAIFDTYNDRVRYVDDAGIIDTIAGIGRFSSTGDGGPATHAILVRPSAVAFGPGNIVYVADTSGNVVRRINADQTIQTVAGTGAAGFAGDGGPGAEALLNSPSGLAVDADGNLFISDTGNQRIRVLTTDGIIATFAGTGGYGNTGDGGPALDAQIGSPRSLTFDADGNLYLISQSTVRRIETDGIIKSVAGSLDAGYDGDGGPATAAKLSSPQGIALDSLGNIYISDTGNNRVRKVGVDGVINTIAGTGQAGFSGDGSPAVNARFYSPTGLTVDADGSVYVADYWNHRIRRIRPDGIIETYAGSGATGAGGGGYSGDGGPALQAQMLNPVDVQFGPSGDMFTVESGLGFVRRIFSQSTVLQGTPSAGAAGVRAVSLQAAAGTLTSTQSFAVLVETPPSVTLPPRSLEVNQGATAIFFMTASGTKPLSYQWLHDGAVLSDFDRVTGSTTPQLTITDAQPGDAGNYTVVVLNATGSTTSDPASLVVHPTIPPSITEQPASVVAQAGSTAQFSVTASGTAPLAYQWQRNGSPIAESGRYSGTTTPLLSIAGVSAADEATYTVVVQNAAGSVSSDEATLKLEAKLPPSITTQPKSLTVAEGGSAQFSVAATGSTPLGYQWKRNGTALVNSGRYSGVNTAQLTIAGARNSDAGDYTVTVQNSAGAATSDVATLKVLVPPLITQQPTAAQIAAGASVTFSVAATGTAPLGYQWKRNGTALVNSGRYSGVTTPNFTISGVRSTDAGDYTVTVRNSAGSVTSDAASLTLIIAPVITQQPQSQTATAGGTVQFSVAATGTAPLDYQWKRNGTALTEDAGRYSGTTTAQLTITGVQNGDAGDFTVTVQNAAGSVTSQIATLKLGSASAPTLSQPSLKSDGTFHFFVSGDAGQVCEIQYAADPVGPWTKLADLTLGTDPAEVQDSDAATSQVRFYRAVVH